MQPYEILRQAWTKSDADVKAPGIVALSKRFNSVANFVVEVNQFNPEYFGSKNQQIERREDLQNNRFGICKHNTYTGIIQAK